MKQKITKKTSILIVLIIIFIFCTAGILTTGKLGKLRSQLENEHMYRYFPMEHFEGSYAAANNSFKKFNKDLKYVAFTGRVRSISSNKKQIKVFYSKDGIAVDTSEESVKKIVESLNIGAYVTIYGKIDGSEVDAEHILVDSVIDYPFQDDLYYPDITIEESETITDLARDKHVTFEIPSTWKNEYVMGRLTNNDVNGYQFFLNAIEPQNLDYPEIFYIFYFNYDQYLDPPPHKPTPGDHRDLEAVVLKNILQKLSGKFDIDFESIKIQENYTDKDTKFDYCQTTYKPLDGRDYRLEFVFKPDDNGLVCMLYLYYPMDDTTSHIEEVSYVISSVTN
ncbi:MAG: hypothetical protein IK007_09525 [Lachnospiraceae bacterium]|nr:hypothetical protein [Lachnospiraceae bacterium]